MLIIFIMKIFFETLLRIQSWGIFHDVKTRPLFTLNGWDSYKEGKSVTSAQWSNCHLFRE